MATVYATQQSDGGLIDDRAYIRAFSSRADAEEWLLDGFDDDEKARAVINPGQYADAWIKMTCKPVEGDDFAPFSWGELRIRKPGSHPGGESYWISPRPDVLIAKLA